MASLHKAEPRMQSQGRLVGRLYASDHGMLVHVLRAQDQSIHQGMADTVSARGAVNIDGMLDRMPITIPGPEGPERRITQDIWAVCRNHDRISGLLALVQPGNTRFKTGKLVVP